MAIIGFFLDLRNQRVTPGSDNSPRERKNSSFNNGVIHTFHLSFYFQNSNSVNAQSVSNTDKDI